MIDKAEKNFGAPGDLPVAIANLSSASNMVSKDNHYYKSTVCSPVVYFSNGDLKTSQKTCFMVLNILCANG